MQEDSDDEGIELGELPVPVFDCTAFEGMRVFLKLLSDKSKYGLNISQTMVPSCHAQQTLNTMVDV